MIDKKILIIGGFSLLVIVVVIIVIINKKKPDSHISSTVYVVNKGNTLLSGQFLNPGDFLQSLNGKYKVVFGGPKGRIILANGNYATGATTQFAVLNLDAIGVKLSAKNL